MNGAPPARCDVMLGLHRPAGRRSPARSIGGCIGRMVLGGLALFGSLTATAAESVPKYVDLDSSLTVSGLRSWSSDVSGTFALGGTTDEPGWRLRVTGLLGRYSYLDPAAPRGEVIGLDTGADLLAGYTFMAGNVSVTGLAGLAVRHSELSFSSPGNPALGTEVGVKGAFSLYATPTPRTMVFLQGHASTVSGPDLVSGKLGLAVAQGIYVGPEVALSGNEDYRELRIGAHVSGLTLGVVQIGVSAGFSHQDDKDPSGYAGLSVRTSF